MRISGLTNITTNHSVSVIFDRVPSVTSATIRMIIFQKNAIVNTYPEFSFIKTFFPVRNLTFNYYQTLYNEKVFLAIDSFSGVMNKISYSM